MKIIHLINRLNIDMGQRNRILIMVRMIKRTKSRGRLWGKCLELVGGKIGICRIVSSKLSRLILPYYLD